MTVCRKRLGIGWRARCIVELYRDCGRVSMCAREGEEAERTCSTAERKSLVDTSTASFALCRMSMTTTIANKAATAIEALACLIS